MEKKQYELCLEILRRFNKTGILEDFILIGSWSAYFYNEYFSGTPYLDRAALRACPWVSKRGSYKNGKFAFSERSDKYNQRGYFNNHGSLEFKVCLKRSQEVLLEAR